MNLLNQLRFVIGESPKKAYAKKMEEIEANFTDIWPGDFRELPLECSASDAEKAGFDALAKGTRLPTPNFLWNMLLKKLIDSSTFMNSKGDKTVYIGEYPSPEFNASFQETCNDGFLILVNSGLKMLFYRIAILFIGSCSFRFGNERQLPPLQPIVAQKVLPAGSNLSK